MGDLEFEPHARDEMASDTISEDEVYHVIGDADVEYVQHNGHTRHERMMDEGTRAVKTAWWDKRASRRHRRR